jgi:hypothetical protein
MSVVPVQVRLQAGERGSTDKHPGSLGHVGPVLALAHADEIHPLIIPRRGSLSRSDALAHLGRKAVKQAGLIESVRAPDRPVQRQVQQHQAPATTAVGRQALLGNGSTRQRGKHCRIEKRKVGGSRPPLTTL